MVLATAGRGGGECPDRTYAEPLQSPLCSFIIGSNQADTHHSV